jgi:biopolymer transport protein ExbD
MFGYSPKSKRHFINKKAKSIVELGESYRERRKSEFHKAMHVFTICIFLTFFFSFGKVYLIFYNPSTIPYKHTEKIKLPKSKSTLKIEISKRRRINVTIKNNTIHINRLDDNLITRDLDRAREFLRDLVSRVPSSQIQIIADKNMKMKYLHRVLKIIRESAFVYNGFSIWF